MQLITTAKFYAAIYACGDRTLPYANMYVITDKCHK